MDYDLGFRVSGFAVKCLAVCSCVLNQMQAEKNLFPVVCFLWASSQKGLRARTKTGGSPKKSYKTPPTS
jgi:hypothetical protein